MGSSDALECSLGCAEYDSIFILGLTRGHTSPVKVNEQGECIDNRPKA